MQDVVDRALDFAKVLDKAADEKPAHYIFLGDFNIMGMQYRYVRERDIVATHEVRKLEQGRSGRR